MEGCVTALLRTLPFINEHAMEGCVTALLRTLPFINEHAMEGCVTALLRTLPFINEHAMEGCVTALLRTLPIIFYIGHPAPQADQRGKRTAATKGLAKIHAVPKSRPQDCSSGRWESGGRGGGRTRG